MKTKVDSKKAASSSSSSSDSSSSDEESAKVSAVKAPVRGAATIKATPKQAEKQAPKSTPKVAAKSSPVKEAIPPKPVPASKFPKAAASSSSSSSSSSDSDSDSGPPAKKPNTATTAKFTGNNVKPALNNTKAAPAANNLKSAKTAPTSAPSSQESQGKVANSPKHVATPVRSLPATSQLVTASPKRDVTVTSAPTPVKRPFNQSALVTSAGDEPYQRVEPKKLVTSVFGSNCPHCGHDIEVKVKFS